MADFPTALDAALRGYYGTRSDFVSPVDSRRGFQARVRALEEKYGTKRAAARAAGISPDTWTRWGTGKQAPGSASLAKVAAAHLSIIRAAKVARRGAPGSLEVQASVACMAVDPRSKSSNKYNQGGPNADYRWFRADRLTGPQRHDIATAWAAGKSPADVADVALRAIERAYGSRFEFEGNNVNVKIY